MGNFSRLYSCYFYLPIFYGTKIKDYEPTTKSVTVDVPLAANGKMSLQDIVDNYIMLQPETIKGIYVGDADEKPVYITLRDKDLKRSLNYIYGELCRPPMQGATAVETQLSEMRLDGLNIDMLNSYIQNGQNTAVTSRITFNY